MSWTVTLSLRRCPRQHLHVFYPEVSLKEPIGFQSLVNLFRNSLAQTTLDWWNIAYQPTKMFSPENDRWVDVTSRHVLSSAEFPYFSCHDLWKWSMCLFCLTAIWYGYGWSLLAFDASLHVALIPWVWLHRDWCTLTLAILTVRRRPSGTPLTASLVFVYIFSFKPNHPLHGKWVRDFSYSFDYEYGIIQP